MKIEFPDITDEDHLQICFIRKYRHLGKTHYMFFNADIAKKVSQSLGSWVKESISKVRGHQIKKYNPSINDGGIESLDLNSVHYWSDFKEKAFIKSKSEVTLEDIKKQVIGVILYLKKGEDVVGQIRRLYPSSILQSKGLYKMFFDGQKFNDLVEDIGLQIDAHADILFYQHGSSTNAVILNKDNFKDIFDMHEQEKEEASKAFNDTAFLSKSKNADMIKEFIKTDRQLQKMLINPAIAEYAASFSFETLKKVKEAVPKEMSYEIDVDKKDFILPNGNEKEALRDVIKVMVGRYNQDFDAKHIFENSNVKRVLK